MLIAESLEQIPSLPPPVALTIGNFDGVHLGHQRLLQRLKTLGTSCVLTFRNHPSMVLRQQLPPPIYPLEQKVKLLEENGVDLLILLGFSYELAEQPSLVFLKKIQETLPFSFLLLGKGAAFGKDRDGDEAHVRALQDTLHFHAEYLPNITLNGRPVSSARIREEIKKNNVHEVERLLGRTYSINE